MSFRKHLAVLLSFSKKERRGIYLLLSICMLVWILPVFFSSEKIPEDILTITPLAINEAKQVLQRKTDSSYMRRKRYVYYSNNQFADSFQPAGDIFKKKQYNSQAFSPRSKQVIDINKADSAQLEKLPGIGEKLSARIIRYRDRLGGFISVSQLREVYGLSDSTMRIIVPLLFVSAQFQPDRIEVNKADYAAFRKHPYFTHTFTKSLLAYRKANGRFASIEEIRRIISLELDEIKKVAPYLSFAD